MSDETTSVDGHLDKALDEPAFKPGDKVIVVATVVKEAGQNWILKLANSAFQTFTPDQFTKQP